MTIRKEVISEKACKPGSLYSQAIIVDDWVFVSGQGALNRDGNVIQGLDMKEQTTITMESIKAILEEARSSLDHVVKVTAHITDHANFEDFNSIYQEYFSIPFPARTTVVSGLAEGMLVEIDVIAKLKK
ncbi:RidA family protein [Bacillus sp. 1P02SD]|uniref:RidA family protein n=1 Tax=Bacillus sp. 1P02SD TaxID=3132264 RepID=UPI0039A12D12